MTEFASPPPAPSRRQPMRTWQLTVVDAFDVTPRMRRVPLVGEAMDDFAWKAGQDLVLNVPLKGGSGAAGETVRRHYTIRSYDAAEQRLEIDFVLHGEGPAARWAQTCELGDEIQAAGPRGRTVLREGVDWHLFVGDETCLPGIVAMLEALPAGARATAIIEVWDKDERQTPLSRADLQVEWFHRNGPAQPGSPLLIDRLNLFAPPPGSGAAYVIGETSTVRAVRQGLIAKGFPRDRIAAEGYWRPGRVGGHDHVFDAQDIPGEVLRRLVR
jgi:NADPH-dependent ferric siderophore reductase